MTAKLNKLINSPVSWIFSGIDSAAELGIKTPPGRVFVVKSNAFVIKNDEFLSEKGEGLDLRCLL